MELSPLTAISPVDGRYRSKCAVLAGYFSEYATIRYRVKVEIEYFIALSSVGLAQLPALSSEQEEALRNIYAPEVFTPAEAQKVKDIEAVTNHDVKAVEYYLKERFDALGLGDRKEFIHFGLTSQDINNTAFPMMLADAINDVVVPEFKQLVGKLSALSAEYAQIPMLAKTHGQPASPTTLGKEVMVFAYRLERQLESLASTAMTGKFGGATGNFNAHRAAFPTGAPSVKRSLRRNSAFSARNTPPRYRTTTSSQPCSMLSRGLTPLSWTSTATSGAIYR